MKTTLYIVRHGETEYNRLRIMQGRRIDSVLNATGEAQAVALAQRLADIPFDAIYASTLKRAAQTAATVAKHHPDAPVYHLKDLEEMSWGILEGEPTSEKLMRILDGVHEYWQAGDYDHRIEEGESIREVETRAVRALNQIVDQHEGQTVLIVAHGRLLRVMLASVLEAYGLARMEEIKHTNTAVNKLVYEDGRFEALVLNDASHLEHAETILVE